MGQQPSGLVTLVFTDIEGSTRLLDELGQDAYREALARHREIVRAAFGPLGGYEVDYEGDAFFYAFASAGDAVRAVSEAMAALRAGPVRIRVGVHTGEPGLDPPKYVGMDVHRAARIMAAGHGGQVLLSEATRLELDESLALCDLGEHRLKDLNPPVQLYQLGDGEFPPLKSLNNTNLPAPANPLVGRERELGQLGELLRREEVRLLTLTGPGGTGKTRLALELAAELVGDYPNGVFFVPLAAIRDPLLVLTTVAQTLGIKEQPGEPLAETLARELETKAMLLFLDNFEQVVDAAPQLADLLSHTPKVNMLVTSRELLRVQGEREYAVPPLVESEGVALFCARSHLEPSSEIAELCMRLDNLPLTVELAAARTTVLSPAQILERLSQRLDLFKGGRDSEARQQTLRATIEWSYDLLNEDEQRLFAGLSIFGGGCTLDTAEAVCEAQLDLLQSLVDKNLLRHTERRFWMLETIREYAAERLEASGDAEELRERFVDRLLIFLTNARPTIQEGKTIAELDAEAANIRAASEWLEMTGRGGELMKLARYVWIYVVIRSPYEARSLLEAALALSPEETEDRARALNGLAGCVLNTSGDLAEAEAIARESVRVSRKIGLSERGGLMTLALVATMQGRFEDARERYEESARISERTGDAEGLREARIGLADLALNRGDFATAEALSIEALPMLGERGQYTLVVLINIAYARIKQGDANGAVDVSRESLELLRELGPTLDLRTVLEALAAVVVVHDACRAATLLGASEAFESLYGSLPPFESGVHDETIGMLERTPRAGWQSCWEQGSRLDPANAIETGLAVCAWLSRQRSFRQEATATD